MDDLTDYFHADLVYVDEEIKEEQYKIPTRNPKRLKK